MTLRRIFPILALCLAAYCSAAEPPKADPPMAAYRLVNGSSNLDIFAKWLGRDVMWGEDFIGSETWNNVAWPVFWLEHWGKWVNAQPGRKFIFGVPILPGPVNGSGPTEGDEANQPVSLEKGASGAYNHHFRVLAENLVKFGLSDTILRPGWEFNGNWYTWQAKGKEEQFAQYWREIVKTMRAVPGAEKLKFCWNTTLGYQQFPAEKAWPGDEYVDYVGLDVYDETWMENTYPFPPGATEAEIATRRRRVWDQFLMYGDHGIAFWLKFCKEHGKPLAFPEWGLNKRDDHHGGLDNVLFIEEMHKIITDPANNIGFHCYFDVDAPDGNHQVSPGEKGTHQTLFPQASIRFRQLFGKGAAAAGNAN